MLVALNCFSSRAISYDNSEEEEEEEEVKEGGGEVKTAAFSHIILRGICGL